MTHVDASNLTNVFNSLMEDNKRFFYCKKILVLKRKNIQTKNEKKTLNHINEKFN